MRLYEAEDQTMVNKTKIIVLEEHNRTCANKGVSKTLQQKIALLELTFSPSFQAFHTDETISKIWVLRTIIGADSSKITKKLQNRNCSCEALMTRGYTI